MVFLCDKPYDNTEYNHHFDIFPYPLSDFQKYAIEGIVTQNHVLVTAHTGSGKTLPAEFAIQFFVGQQKKVIYTSPIKALSNQKFYEFTRKYPHISFGLFTGDIKTNPNADVLIMTTEILMNYLYNYQKEDTCENPLLQFQINIQTELACVIFDEVHYINDQERGQVWEQTILMLPPHIQMVMLSATIDNPEGFAKWCEKGNSQKTVYLASTEHRVVPLTHYLFMTTTETPYKTIKDKGIQQEIRDVTNQFIKIRTPEGKFIEKGYYQLKKIQSLFDKHQFYMKRKFVLNKLAEKLKQDEMLPAIAFVFSRKNVEVCASEITTNLLEDDSKVPYIVRRECEEIVRKFPNFREYLELPEYQQVVGLLEKGIGIHHSGMIPVLREIVELMIAKKYIKLLFATESFAIGLDCPIKTAVFISLTKFDGSSQRFLLPHEYTQMAGRAGRRGIDTVGHVIHCNNLFDIPDLHDYQQILCGKPQQLISKFHIHYSMILNLIKSGESLDGFQSFTNQSMIYNELQSSIRGSKLQIEEKEEALQKKNEAVQQIKTPIEICLSYIDTTEHFFFYRNNMKKQADKELRDLEKTYISIKEDCQLVRDTADLEKEISKEKSHLKYLESSIERQIGNICEILKDSGCITDDHQLTQPLGQIVANIHEIHPLIMGELLIKTRFFADFEMSQMVAILSIFTQVNVQEEDRVMLVPNTNFQEKSVILDIKESIEKYEEKESGRLCTGIQYDSMIQYDLYDNIKEWIVLETEQQCKYFIQNKLAECGISIGDFTKAVLKVICISRELITVCELLGELNLLYKCKQIEPALLKYVITYQSLYI